MSELPGTIRVYVGAKSCDVARGATALDAVRAADSAAADGVLAGSRRITDSRGLEVDPRAAAFAGAIFRIVSARPRS